MIVHTPFSNVASYARPLSVASAVFRMRGKGIPYLRGSGRGDQFVTIRIAVPKNLTSAQKELLRQFAATTGEADTLKTGLFNKKKK